MEIMKDQVIRLYNADYVLRLSWPQHEINQQKPVTIKHVGIFYSQKMHLWCYVIATQQ